MWNNAFECQYDEVNGSCEYRNSRLKGDIVEDEVAQIWSSK